MNDNFTSTSMREGRGRGGAGVSLSATFHITTHTNFVNMLAGNNNGLSYRHTHSPCPSPTDTPTNQGGRGSSAVQGQHCLPPAWGTSPAAYIERCHDGWRGEEGGERMRLVSTLSRLAHPEHTLSVFFTWNSLQYIHLSVKGGS